MIRPRGPVVAGPTGGGPQIVLRQQAQADAQNAKARDSLVAIGGPIGGAISSMVGSYFLGPIGAVAGQIAGQRIVQEQANTMYGRPFFEGTGQYTSESNVLPLIISAIGSGVGGYVGSAVGGATGSTTGATIGGAVGSRAGSYGGSYLGGTIAPRQAPRPRSGYVYGGY